MNALRATAHNILEWIRKKRKRIRNLLTNILLFLLFIGIAKALSLSYVDPTPSYGGQPNVSNIYNFSMGGADLIRFSFAWNDTNATRIRYNGTTNIIEINMTFVDTVTLQGFNITLGGTNFRLLTDQTIAILPCDNWTRYLDITPYANHFDLVTADWGTAIAKYGGSFDFIAASNDYMNCTLTLNELADSTQGTISLWFYPDGDRNTEEQIIGWSNGAGTTQSELDLIMDSRSGVSEVYAMLNKDGTQQWYIDPSGSTSVLFGAWNHIVLVHNGSEAGMYVNGVAQTLTWTTTTAKSSWLKSIITDATNKANTCHVGILKRSSAYIIPFDGKVDEILIFNRSLSQGEIHNLFSSQLTQHLPNQWGFFSLNASAGNLNFIAKGVNETMYFNRESSTSFYFEDNRTSINMTNHTYQGQACNATACISTTPRPVWIGEPLGTTTTTLPIAINLVAPINQSSISPQEMSHNFSISGGQGTYNITLQKNHTYDRNCYTTYGITE